MPYYPRVQVFRRGHADGRLPASRKLGSREQVLVKDDNRFELTWQAGQKGIPSANADLLSATEATNETCDPHFEILGTNAATDLAVHSAEGGIKMTTAGADDDQVILCPHLDANETPWTQVTWGTDRETQWECLIESGSSIALIQHWCGLKLTNTSTVATDDDQVYFSYNPEVNDELWSVVSSIGGTDTTTVTGKNIVAATQYHLAIDIDSARRASCFINGEHVYTTAALTDAVDFIPYIGVQALTGAAKHMYVYGQAISRLYGAS